MGELLDMVECRQGVLVSIKTWTLDSKNELATTNTTPPTLVFQFKISVSEKRKITLADLEVHETVRPTITKTFGVSSGIFRKPTKTTSSLHISNSLKLIISDFISPMDFLLQNRKQKIISDSQQQIYEKLLKTTARGVNVYANIQVLTENKYNEKLTSIVRGVERMKRIVVAKEENCCCSICMEELEFDDKKRKTELPCSHKFHQQCLISWMIRNNTCPLCRFQVDY